jgi:hypothetical protein
VFRLWIGHLGLLVPCDADCGQEVPHTYFNVTPRA